MRGGKRPGAGRPSGSGRFGEATTPMRVPDSLVGVVSDLIASHCPDLSAERSHDTNTSVEVVLDHKDCSVWAAQDAATTLHSLYRLGEKVQTVILDPWYSATPHRHRRRSLVPLLDLIQLSGRLAQHVFVWGWPADVAPLVERIPPPLVFRQWLTWHYSNVPSRSKGWRPTQQACLHLSRASAPLYPGNLQSTSGLFQIGADSVIRAGALTGFAGRSQSVGHPAQKPLDVIRPLILMTTLPGDLVVDPMAGSGTTGVVCSELWRRSILCDHNPKYVRLIHQRIQSL